MMTREQAKLIGDALTAGADGHGHDVAPNACAQAADELNILMQAIHQGAANWIVCNVMSGIEARLRAAAELNGDIRKVESEAAS